MCRLQLYVITCLVLLIIAGCSGGGSIEITGTGTLNSAPQILSAGLQATPGATGASAVRIISADGIPARFVITNINDSKALVSQIGIVLQHDPDENSEMNSSLALQRFQQGPPPDGDYDLVYVDYLRPEQTVEIAEYQGQPLEADSRYWISAVFIGPNGNFSPVSQPQRFKCLPPYYPLLEAPVVGVEKTIEGTVTDSQGPLADALVILEYEGLPYEADLTDENGRYEMKVQLPNPKASSSLKSVSDGEVNYATNLELIATHANFPSVEVSKYLDPENVQYRVDLTFNLDPVAVLAAAPVAGGDPLQVEFEGSSSYDPDGDIVQYDFDFDGDGTYELIDAGSAVQHFYLASGIYTAVLRVWDNMGASNTTSVEITVGIDDYWETENNDDYTTANAMPVDYHPYTDGFSHTGVFSVTTDADWFSIDPDTSNINVVTWMISATDVPAGETVTVKTFNSALTELDNVVLASGQICQVARCDVNNQPAGVFYLQVTSTAAGIEYDLSLIQNHTYLASENFYESEPNNSSSQADVLPFAYDPDTDGCRYTNIFTSGDTSADWFQWDATDSGYVAFHISGIDYASNEYVTVVLYNASMQQLDSATLGYEMGAVVLNTTAPVAAGTYYLSISPNTWTHRVDVSPHLIQP